jgi:hypothetical protein
MNFSKAPAAPAAIPQKLAVIVLSAFYSPSVQEQAAKKIRLKKIANDFNPRL